MINPKMLNAEMTAREMTPNFKTAYPLSTPVSFNFSPETKKMLKYDISEKEISMGKERREENKKVKAHGRRGRGKGAIE